MALKVKLISHSPDPQKIIACAARLCYSAGGIDELMDNMSAEKADELVEMLAGMGHESPLEHLSFTFGIEGVSRALLAQLTRHRIASYSVQSQRYVSERDFEYVIPPQIEALPEAKEEFLKAMREDCEHYNNLTNMLAEKYCVENLTAGMQEKDARTAARKSAIEDARFVLPNACDTKLIMTMNARSLINFFALRCCSRAQWEIRELSWEMLRLVRRVAPQIFNKAGPPCVRGKCTEGKMSCGKTAFNKNKS